VGQAMTHAGPEPPRMASAPLIFLEAECGSPIGRGIVTEVYYPTIDRPFWPMAGRLSEKNSKSGQFFKLSALLASR